MDVATAREIARISHGSERDRFGDLVIDHVERVAAAVPQEACVTALLHDVFECGHIGPDELLRSGLNSVELEAVQLLTRASGESFELHVLTIEHAHGPAGRLARAVKLADLDDCLRRGRLPPGAPPCAWARRHIANGIDRYDDTGRLSARPARLRAVSVSAG